MSTHNTFHTFASLQAARDYRHEHGTGGWIFAPEDIPYVQGQSILFPPEFTPTNIWNHPFTKGLSGVLVGN